MIMTLNQRIQIRNDQDPASKYRVLLDNIPQGIDDAISMKELSEILGTTERETRSRVLKCRISGNIIGSTDNGYYIPDQLWELVAHHHRAASHIRSSSLALLPVKRFLINQGCIETYYESLIPEG